MRLSAITACMGLASESDTRFKFRSDGDITVNDNRVQVFKTGQISLPPHSVGMGHQRGNSPGYPANLIPALRRFKPGRYTVFPNPLDSAGVLIPILSFH